MHVVGVAPRKSRHYRRAIGHAQAVARGHDRQRAPDKFRLAERGCIYWAEIARHCLAAKAVCRHRDNGPANMEVSCQNSEVRPTIAAPMIEAAPSIVVIVIVDVDDGE